MKKKILKINYNNIIGIINNIDNIDINDDIKYNLIYNMIYNSIKKLFNDFTLYNIDKKTQEEMFFGILFTLLENEYKNKDNITGEILNNLKKNIFLIE